MKKTIVRIGGGLGNQMFQFANAWRISQATGKLLCLDKSEFFNSLFFDKTWRRIFLLDRFPSIRATPCLSPLPALFYFSLWVMRKFLPPRMMHRLFRLFRIVWFDSGPGNLVPEQVSLSTVGNRDSVFCSGVPCHLALLPPRKELRSLFAFGGEQMLAANTVSVHIRRTDYVTGGGCLPIDYYEKAMDKMSECVPNPRWVFFSDDIEWCQEAFAHVRNATFVHGDIVNPVGDLAQMVACHHHIIANSTFSWWGAYLGADDAIVIYPSNWEAESAQVGDHIPEDWIRIDLKPL